LKEMSSLFLNFLKNFFLRDQGDEKKVNLAVGQ